MGLRTQWISYTRNTVCQSVFVSGQCKNSHKNMLHIWVKHIHVYSYDCVNMSTCSPHFHRSFASLNAISWHYLLCSFCGMCKESWKQFLSISITKEMFKSNQIKSQIRCCEWWEWKWVNNPIHCWLDNKDINVRWNKIKSIHPRKMIICTVGAWHISIYLFHPFLTESDNIIWTKLNFNVRLQEQRDSFKQNLVSDLW